jgi:hypothetical protein
MHRASTAKARAAPEFGAGQAERIAQDPEKRGIGLGIHVNGFAIDLQRKHRHSPPCRVTREKQLHHDTSIRHARTRDWAVDTLVLT